MRVPTVAWAAIAGLAVCGALDLAAIASDVSYDHLVHRIMHKDVNAFLS